jgi:hypothetical protein
MKKVIAIEQVTFDSRLFPRTVLFDSALSDREGFFQAIQSLLSRDSDKTQNCLIHLVLTEISKVYSIIVDAFKVEDGMVKGVFHTIYPENIQRLVLLKTSSEKQFRARYVLPNVFSSPFPVTDPVYSVILDSCKSVESNMTLHLHAFSNRYPHQIFGNGDNKVLTIPLLKGEEVICYIQLFKPNASINPDDETFIKRLISLLAQAIETKDMKTYEEAKECTYQGHRSLGPFRGSMQTYAPSQISELTTYKGYPIETVDLPGVYLADCLEVPMRDSLDVTKDVAFDAVGAIDRIVRSCSTIDFIRNPQTHALEGFIANTRTVDIASGRVFLYAAGSVLSAEAQTAGLSIARNNKFLLQELVRARGRRLSQFYRTATPRVLGMTHARTTIYPNYSMLVPMQIYRLTQLSLNIKQLMAGSATEIEKLTKLSQYLKHIFRINSGLTENVQQQRLSANIDRVLKQLAIEKIPASEDQVLQDILSDTFEQIKTLGEIIDLTLSDDTDLSDIIITMRTKIQSLTTDDIKEEWALFFQQLEERTPTEEEALLFLVNNDYPLGFYSQDLYHDSRANQLRDVLSDGDAFVVLMEYRWYTPLRVLAKSIHRGR